MAPQQNQTSASTSQQNQSSSSSSSAWPCRTVKRLRDRWTSRSMQGPVPKILFMTGFLVNSAAMSALFFLLDHEWDANTSNTTQQCLPFKKLYEYSINASFPFFVFVSVFIFCVTCLMQCRRYKLEKNAYKTITILAASTFLFSILLVLISSSAILSVDDQSQCTKLPKVIMELKLRYVFQSSASLITSSIYLIIGISLIKSNNQRSTVNPLPPTTPIYQITPPEFDSFFQLPPPTYQQSQLHHQQGVQ